MILPLRSPGAWLLLFAALGAIGWGLLQPSMMANGRRPLEEAPLAPPRGHLVTAAPEPIPGPLRVDDLRIVDGDTFGARVRVWFGHEVRSLIRIRGFDAPERAARCVEEARRAAEATDMLAEILAAGPVRVSSISGDKFFGRVVADVSVRLRDGHEADVASLMLAAGHGRPYAGRRRETWCGGAEPPADQRMARTGVPTDTRANRSITSSSSMRMQP